MIYHVVKRIPGKMQILEHVFDYIDIDNITLLSERGDKMINSYLLSKELIDISCIIKLMNACGLKYEIGFDDANVWVKNSKGKAVLVVDANKIDENGISKVDNNNLEEFSEDSDKLPLPKPHIISIEHEDYKIFVTFIKEMAKAYPDAYIIHETENDFIPLKDFIWN